MDKSLLYNTIYFVNAISSIILNVIVYVNYRRSARKSQEHDS
jgi:hypothetical protein